MTLEYDPEQQELSRATPSSAQISRDSVQRLVRSERKRSEKMPIAKFQDILALSFDKKTINQILETLDNLQLPAPLEGVEFLRAYEGALFFSNICGMVLRIEPVDDRIKMAKKNSDVKIERIDDNPFVLQPIASRRCGNAIIEICPGVHTSDSITDLENVKFALHMTGVQFFDAASNNVGRLPIANAEFPHGIPVVIDRLSVSRLSETPQKISEALAFMGLKRAPQDDVYGGLRAAFLDAWPEESATPDAVKMQTFWRRMIDATDQGLLVAGWNEKINDTYKIIDARVSAVAYDQKLRKHFSAAGLKTRKATTDAGLRTSSAPAPGKR